MPICAGSGSSGTLEFRKGSDEWWVYCPVCGVRWAGGGSDPLRAHEDKRSAEQRRLAAGQQGGEGDGYRTDEPSSGERAEARRLEYGRRNAQGIVASFSSYLSILGILNEMEDFDRGVTLDEEGRISLDPASVAELSQVLEDFLPDCWSPRVDHGFPAPDYCEWSGKDLCDVCSAAGKRFPKYRPPRP
ncbi:hypothetical protein GCM10027020_20400 [Nocardioides salsibiostraticola]